METGIVNFHFLGGLAAAQELQQLSEGKNKRASVSKGAELTIK